MLTEFSATADFLCAVYALSHVFILLRVRGGYGFTRIFLCELRIDGQHTVKQQRNLLFQLQEQTSYTRNNSSYSYNHLHIQ